ncbi:hypothetical protein STSO111631_15620 [Stackebrandtia soli]
MVDLAGRQRPKLLAALLIEPGSVIPRLRLIDALWEHSPPDTADRQLRNLAGMLRRELGDAGADLHVTAAGYRLDLTRHRLDAVRFAELVTLGRTQARDGDAAAARASLAEALGLWRGDALSGLDGGMLRSAADRLDESRLAAIEDRIDLDLDLGAHRDVVGESRQLLQRHPYRQRLCGQLMRALHHAGRTAEALDAYESFRARLGDDIGIDPNDDLKSLHVSILRSEVPAAPVVPVAPAPQSMVPAQLPLDTVRFTGRERELSMLDGLLAEDPDAARLAVVAGPGGAGKTALTLRWGHRNSDRFPDGQLYLNLRGFDRGEPLSPMVALAQLLGGLGVTSAAVPDDVDSAAALYRSRLANRRMLILLDNARDVDQLRPLLPGGGDSVVLATSRNRMLGLVAVNGATPIAIDSFRREESVKLLKGLLSDAIDDAAADELAEQCADLPLALRIAAAHILARGDGAADFVVQLRDGNRLDELSADSDFRAAVAATFELSLSALDAPARRLIMRLSQIPGEDFERDLAIAISTEDDTRVLLDRLETAHLLERHRGDRYRFHDLIGEYVAVRAHQAGIDVEWIAEPLIEWLHSQTGRFTVGDYRNLLAVADATGDHPKGWQAVVALQQLLNVGCAPSEIRQRIEVALRRAQVHGDEFAQVMMLKGLATSYWADRREADAIPFARRSMELATRIDDTEHIGNAGATLGLILYANSDYVDAEAMILESLRIAVEAGDRRRSLARGSNLATVRRVLGRFAGAMELYEQEWMRMPVADASAELSHRYGRGQLAMEMRRYDEALVLYDAILEESRRARAERFEEMVLTSRAEQLIRLGDVEAGLSEALAANAVSERSGMPCSPRALIMQTRALAELGDFDGVSAVLALAAADRPRPSRATTLELRLVRGLMARRMGRLTESVALIGEAIELAREIEGRPAELRCLLELGLTHLAADDIPAARHVAARIRALLRELDIESADRVDAIDRFLTAVPE